MLKKQRLNQGDEPPEKRAKHKIDTEDGELPVKQNGSDWHIQAGGNIMTSIYLVAVKHEIDCDSLQIGDTQLMHTNDPPSRPAAETADA